MTTGKLKETPRIRIIKGIPEGPIKVPVDPFQLEEIFSTLLENAVEAIERQINGQRGMSRENSRVHHVNILIKVEGDLCKIKVQDSGGGMDWEAYESLFVKREPYSPFKKGHGLLKVQQYISEIPGASIKVEIQSARGTTFKIILPLADDGSESDHSTEEILNSLEKRHWNI